MPRIASLFSTAERSGGSPVECFTFQRGTRVWRYTSSDAPVTIGGLTFVPANVKRGDLSQKKDAPGVQVAVTVNLATDLAQALMVETSERVTLTIQKVQSAGSAIKAVLAG